MLFSRGKMKQYINQLLDQLHTLWLIVETARLFEDFTNNDPDIVLRMTAPLLRRT